MNRHFLTELPRGWEARLWDNLIAGRTNQELAELSVEAHAYDDGRRVHIVLPRMDILFAAFSRPGTFRRGVPKSLGYGKPGSRGFISACFRDMGERRNNFVWLRVPRNSITEASVIVKGGPHADMPIPPSVAGAYAGSELEEAHSDLRRLRLLAVGTALKTDNDPLVADAAKAASGYAYTHFERAVQ